MPAYPLSMLLVFALTLFTSATLLMMVQPIIGKMITPLLGGTPAVWNTCMVFFQAILLAGYAYAHVTTKWLGPRKQALLHFLLLAAPFFFFPVAVNKDLIQGDLGNPIPQLLLLLVTSVGVPFFVLSTSAPLLQKWFSSTTHPAAKDPYFLYAASNVGSMLALLSYPTLIEPHLRLREQTWSFGAGYALLVVLIAGCAAFMWLAPAAKTEVEDSSDSEIDVQRPVTWPRRLRWVVLAAVPSSLMLGATTYMTTDIAAIPLLWVLPLALYLLSFIIVFSQVPAVVHKTFVLLLPIAMLSLAFVMLSQNLRPALAYLLGIHLATLFVAAMVCHGELARDRPSTKYLTEFFLWMSFGGVVGGMFNGLVAPVLFDGIVEYQLAMVVACLLLPPLGLTKETRWTLFGDLGLAALCLTLGTALIGVRFWEHSFTLARIKEGPYLWLTASVLAIIACGVVAALRGKAGQARSSLKAATVPIALLLGILTLNGLALWGFYLTSRSALEEKGWDGYLLLAFSLAGLAALNLGAVCCLYWTRTDDRQLQRWLDLLLPFAVLLLGVGLIWGLKQETILSPYFFKACDYYDQNPLSVACLLCFGIPALIAYSFFERSVRFGLCVAAIFLASLFTDSFVSTVLYQKRSFFGVMHVDREPGPSNQLVHGTTIHGRQFLDQPEEPLTYFHRTGPIGCVYGAYNVDSKRNLAVIGLGTGTLACYANKGQTLTFYDIDPVVREISYASPPQYFTFIDLAQKRGATVNLIMGDARLTMERQHFSRDEDKYYILVLDAFSSDAIPIHLITYEALLMYLDRLADDGLLCFHISNRYLDLKPVLGNLANKYCKEHAGKSLVGFYMNDGDEGPKSGSTWAVLARDRKHLTRLKLGDRWDESLGLTDMDAAKPDKHWEEIGPTLRALGVQAYALEPRWYPLPVLPRVGEWTDDYAPILRVFTWW